MDLGEGSGEQGPHRGRALGKSDWLDRLQGTWGLGQRPRGPGVPPKRLGAGWNMERRGQPRSELRSSCWATRPLTARPGPGATPPGAPAARSRLSPCPPAAGKPRPCRRPPSCWRSTRRNPHPGQEARKKTPARTRGSSRRMSKSPSHPQGLPDVPGH